MRNRHGRFDRLKTGTGHDGKSRAFAKPGEAPLSTHHDPNEARAGDVGIAPHFMKPAAKKTMHPVSVHNGMSKVAKTGAVAHGGDHASALDSLSGQVVVPGDIKSAPSWGNSGVRSGHPLAKPPGEKKLTPVKLSPGMRSRQGSIAASLDDPTLRDLGAAIKDEGK